MYPRGTCSMTFDFFLGSTFFLSLWRQFQINGANFSHLALSISSFPPLVPSSCSFLFCIWMVLALLLQCFSLRMADWSMHYGTKSGHFETSKIHFPTSEGVSEVSERANVWAQQRARVKRAVRSKWTSERRERTSKWTREWPSTPICILGWSGPQRNHENMVLFIH